MRKQIREATGSMQELVAAIFSWTILSALSIIISGKLVVKRLPIGLSDEALFKIPLHYFRIEATGEEVSIGFLLFLLSLGFSVMFGGKVAYQFFRENAGIDIGQWSSLCVIACFFSLLFSTLICIVVPILKARPLLSQRERDETNDKLRGS